MQTYGAGQDSVNFVKYLRIPFLQNTSGRLLLQLLNETHLEVVKGLIQLRVFNQYINNKSSSERCYYVRTERTDICQKITSKCKILYWSSLHIFSTFSALVVFGSRSTYILYQYISSFCRSNISYRFLSNLSAAWVSSLRVKYDIFRNEDLGTWQKRLE